MRENVCETHKRCLYICFLYRRFTLKNVKKTKTYNGIKNTYGKYVGYNNKIKSKESIASRFKKRQYFSEEQQLEYNKIIAKLTVLETSGELRSILPTKADNSSLIATICMAFSSGELIHYKDIQAEDIVSVSKEQMDVLALVQQLKERGIDNESLKSLEKRMIGFINDGYKLPIEENQYLINNNEITKDLSIEEIYNVTKGRISYEKAKIAVEFLSKLSQSRIKAIDYANVIQELGSEYKEIAEEIEKGCFAVDKDIISREDNIGVKIAESVNIGLTREKRRFVSNGEQLKLIESIRGLNIEELKKITDPNGLNTELTILEDLLEKDEDITENQYFAEAIVDGLNIEKIYKTISDEKRIITEEERTILVNKLIS